MPAALSSRFVRRPGGWGIKLSNGPSNEVCSTALATTVFTYGAWCNTPAELGMQPLAHVAANTVLIEVGESLCTSGAGPTRAGTWDDTCRRCKASMMGLIVPKSARVVHCAGYVKCQEYWRASSRMHSGRTRAACTSTYLCTMAAHQACQPRRKYPLVR